MAILRPNSNKNLYPIYYMLIRSLFFFAVVGFLALFQINQVHAQEIQSNLYYQVKISVNQSSQMQQMADAGLAIDHIHFIDDATFVAELGGFELEILNDLGVVYQILIHDVSAYVENRNIQEAFLLNQMPLGDDIPANFRYGTMGGFLTFSQVIEELDSMRELFPELITEKFSIGQSIEGNDIWTVWIGKDFDESKPQAYYNSLIHAREPGSMTAVIYYMWWLLENYGYDETATFIVDNRHLAFTPVINPDGYLFNEMMNPNGGGMHRKNRRGIGTNNQGVDLNRNFGPFIFWNHPNGGSSDNVNSDTYRGDAPFSEPETQAMRDFVLENDFRTVFNYHSYSDLLIYPYGALRRETQDFNIFRNFAQDMTEFNDYQFGRDNELLPYNTRGNSDDWYYGVENNHPPHRGHTIAMTPEVGAFWFWPSVSNIIPDSKNNLHPNILLALYAGPEFRIYDFTRNTAGLNNDDIDAIYAPVPELDVLDRGDLNYLSFIIPEFYNYGRTFMDGVLSLESDHEGVLIMDSEITLSTIKVDETYSGPTEAFVIELTNDVEPNSEIELVLSYNVPFMRQTPSWSYTFTAVGSSVNVGEDLQTPQDVYLMQNYPNPFNPTTEIRFALPESQRVSLQVYDSMGRMVQTLINGTMSQGVHQIQFDATNVASGIYFYRLQAGDVIHTRKMTLVK